MKRGMISKLLRHKKIYGFMASIILSTSLVPTAALAAHFYVDGAKVDDSLDGSSVANAERNIFAAILDAAGAGAGPHTIHVLAGYYTDGSVGFGTGTELLALVPPDATALVAQNGTGSVTIEGSNGAGVVLMATDYTNSAVSKMDGFVIKNNGGTAVIVNGDSVAGAPTIQNCTIQGSADGIYVSAFSDQDIGLVLRNNTISNSTGDGVEFYLTDPGTKAPSLSGNTIASNGSYGVNILFSDSGGATIAVSGGTINTNGDDGIYVYGNTDAPVSINVSNIDLSNNTGSGLFLYANSDTLNVRASGVTAMGDSYGMEFYANTSATLNVNVSNSTIDSNINDGIWVSARTSGTVNATLSGGSIDSNNNDGIYVTNNTNGNISFSLSNTSLNGNSNDGIYVTGSSDSQTNLTLSGTDVDSNIYEGFDVRVSNNAGVTLGFTNGSASSNTSGGMYLSAASSGTLTATLAQATIDGNDSDGVYFFMNDSGSIGNLTVSNTTANSNTDDGMHLYASTSSEIHATFTNVTLDGNTTDGLNLSADSYQVLDVTVSGSTITNNTSYGVEASVWDYSGSINLDINNTVISNNSDTGLYVAAAAYGAKIGLNLSGSTLEDNDDRGIEIYSWYPQTETNATLTGSSITDSYNTGIQVSATSGGFINLVATDNCVTDNGWDGLYADVYDDSQLAFTLSNNSFSSNADDGVELTASSNGRFLIQMSHNKVHDNLGRGVNLWNWDYNSSVMQAGLSGNSIMGNAGEGLYVSASNSNSLLLDLGGGGLGSVGQNVIKDNNGGIGFTQAYFDSTLGVVRAENNWWPQDPPLVGTSGTDDIQNYANLDVDPSNAVPLPLTANIAAGHGGDAFTITITDGSFVDNVGCSDRLVVTFGGAAATDLAVSADGLTLTGTVPDNGNAGKGKLVVTNAAGVSGSLDFLYKGPVLATDLSNSRVYPNPFMPAEGHTAISFDSIPAGTIVKIYTPHGELVRELVAGANGEALWDGLNDAKERAASGVYFAILQGNGESKTMKVAIQR